MAQVPYFMLVACPDHKRPGVRTETGHVTGDVRTALLKIIAAAMMDRELGACNSFSDVHAAVYAEAYMEHDPFEMRYYADGAWTKLTYDFGELAAAKRKRRRMF